MNQSTVMVTGISGSLGRLFAQQQHRLGRRHLLGIDETPVTDLPKDIDFEQVKLSSHRFSELFRGRCIDAIVHTVLASDACRSGAGHLDECVVGTLRLLENAVEHGVRKVVVVSSAAVYGPRAASDQRLTEDAPLLGGKAFPELHDVVAADMHATNVLGRLPQDRLEWVLLRPVHVIGRINNAASAYLRMPRIPYPIGYDPMMQILHESDLIEAMTLALEPGVSGIFNLTGADPVPLSRVLKATGKPTVGVPGMMLKGAMLLRRQLIGTSLRSADLQHLKYACIVDGTRAQQHLGYHPRYGLSDTIKAALNARPD